MKNIFAEIITIGDEILYGQITDTNSQWISENLDKNGIRTIRKSSVGDNESEIINILKEAEQRADIILITGGLGPTNDDITKNTLAKYFNCNLKLDEQGLKDVISFFKTRDKELTELNRQQAFLPEACSCISNKLGTAPGMWFNKNNKVIISMPGVPFEMKAMMKEFIIPKLKEKFNPPFLYHKLIRTVGIGESFLSEKIKVWENNLPTHIRLAYLPALGEVKLRLTGSGTDIQKIKLDVESCTQTLTKIIPDYIYGYDNDTLPKIIGDILKQKNLTIATAESCTGGCISYLLTTIPGSSEYYWGSVVAYHNDIKKEALNVKSDTLKKFGAVSEETAKEMAKGIRKKFKTNIGISSTGVAGPSGGTEEKPVGTVWIAYSDEEEVITKKLMLGGDRDLNVKQTAIAALDLIRQRLVKKS
jgi:nicotinamide-nucleotide amidase